jgi:hypothetical protein
LKKDTSMKTSELPAIGAALAGGFFAGRFQIDGAPYALICSPAEGDIEGKWGEYGKKLDGCRSFVDGRKNTVDLAEAGSELARHVLQLDIAGFTDWFIPARDQLELLYRHLKPTEDDNWCSYLDGYNAHSVPPGDIYEDETPAQTSAAEFKAGGTHALQPTWYWSSTQYSAGHACYQSFESGDQGSDAKNVKLRARAVRMIQLSD